MTPLDPPAPRLDRARWERLKTLFQGALEQPPEERAGWLRNAAGRDEDLLAEAKALLLVHDTAGDFLEQPPQVDPGDLPEPDGPYGRGARIGDYTILAEIGRGGMGVVYLAEDLNIGHRRVAIKSLPTALARDNALRERLRREASAAGKISHPGVAVVYALEEIDDQLLLVTEYVPGRTLREEIAAGPIAADRAVQLTLEIVRALAAAHDAGVIHRDLKPENVIITAGGSIKVVDFGIAYIEGGGTRHTVEGSLIGTPAYMAPEQLAGSRGDARADLYAAGIVFAEMLTGHHPLDTRANGPALPEELRSVIARCLSTQPGDRFGNARELLWALEHPSRPAGEGVADGPPRTPARWWWEFHQGIVALVYWLMLIPAWSARGLLGGTTSRIFFSAAIAAVIVAANLRLHLWFTSRFYPGELAWLRQRIGMWIHLADWTLAAVLVAGALLLDDRSPLAILLLAFGIGAAVGFLVIEPATTRAAFRPAPRP